jgi:MoaA/NifB/PqqE/SkfB family radical SAM enzyme
MGENCHTLLLTEEEWERYQLADHMIREQAKEMRQKFKDGISFTRAYRVHVSGEIYDLMNGRKVAFVTPNNNVHYYERHLPPEPVNLLLKYRELERWMEEDDG